MWGGEGGEAAFDDEVGATPGFGHAGELGHEIAAFTEAEAVGGNLINGSLCLDDDRTLGKSVAVARGVGKCVVSGLQDLETSLEADCDSLLFGWEGAGVEDLQRRWKNQGFLFPFIYQNCVLSSAHGVPSDKVALV